ncbi:MAG: WYL domain-containing protein, partial [Deltaproteobacteria bacterium]
DEGGYTIDREEYAMPELDLAPEELAILFVAGSAALQIDGFPLSVDLRMALNKIAWKAEDDALPSMASLVWKQQPGTRPRTNRRLQQHLKRLQEAITSRKSVVLSYYSFWRDEQNRRKVDPYGLGFVRGSWFLVGYCHLRKAIRVFHLDRVTALEVNRLRPSEPDYDIPEGFKVQDHLAAVPWQMRVHPPRRAQLLLKGPSARAAAAELGQEVQLVQQGPDQMVVSFEATFLDGLVPTLLSWRDRVKVLEPPEMVEKVKKALGRIAEEGDACP